jgi:AcrR family transcriptional regulator
VPDDFVQLTNRNGREMSHDMIETSTPDAPSGVRPAYQARSRQQRDRLLKAGERAFAESGYWGTHVTDIARRAGCSVGSFYRRFEDKEALFLALQADMTERAETNIARFFDDPARADEPLETVFTRLVAATARTMRGIEGYYRALFELSLRGHDVWPRMRRIEQLEGRRLVALLQTRGVSVTSEAEARATLAMRMMQGHIVSALLHGPGPWAAEDPELHGELARMLLRYLGASERVD